MRDDLIERANTISEFRARLVESLARNTFVRLVLSPGAPSPAALEKVIGRVIELKNQPHLSLTFRYPNRDETQNLPVNTCADWIGPRLGAEFANAVLGTTRGDWQLSLPQGKRARLIRHKASTRTAPERQHDRTRVGLLDATAQPWLHQLGVTDAKGNVRAAMASKHTQISRYLEIFSHLAKEAGWTDESGRGKTPFGQSESGTQDLFTIVDMGCGKGYLTFGLWHLWVRVWGLNARVVGVETRPELVDVCNRLARDLSANGLAFRHGTIQSMDLDRADALIALHACDVATDAAIERGVRLGSQLIIVAPCCHKEVRPQLGRPEPLDPVLRHGLMQERMAEWVTDGLRALFLEWAGYRTKLFEFVSSEHTPKNLMIAAIRERPAFADLARRARIMELKRFFDVQTHSLDPLLGPD